MNLSLEATHHMPSSLNRSKSQTRSTPHHSSFLSINNPLPQRLASKFLLLGPFQIQSPGFVAYKVTNPVVRADIYESLHTTFKQRSYVVISQSVFIHLGFKGQSNFS